MFSDDFRAKYLLEVGLRNATREELQQAYEKAHRIREFEIELYWKRTAYFWAMQAALIAVAVLLRSTAQTITYHTDKTITISAIPDLSSLLFAVLLSTLSLCIAVFWYLMLQGAKFWQNNWERHVDILGQEIGQNLYQVYPTKDTNVPPYSVTKINGYVVIVLCIFWFFAAISDLCALTGIAAQAEHWLVVFLTFIAILLLYALAIWFIVSQFRDSVFFKGIKMTGIDEKPAFCDRDKEEYLYLRKGK